MNSDILVSAARLNDLIQTGNCTVVDCLTAELRALLHLRELVGEKEHLAVIRTSDQGVFGIARVLDHEALVSHVLLAAHTL